MDPQGVKQSGASMTTGDLIRRMVIAFGKGDYSAFRDAVLDLIAEERRKNHNVYARELERLLSNAEPPATLNQVESLTLLGVRNGDLPRDKDKDAVLVDIVDPQRALDDLVLLGSVRRVLDRIVEENRRGELIRSHGLTPIKKILFCGPPGCGKTVAAEAVAAALYLPLVVVRFDAVVSSYLGETAANLRKVFDFVRSRAMVVLFDEFDAIGKRRTDDAEHGELKRVVNSFLQMLDRFRGDAVLIAATNHQGLLDSAIWRRFDEVLLFPLPTDKEMEAVLLKTLRQVVISPNVSLPRVVASLKGMSHADVERVAIDSLKQMILTDRREIDQTTLDDSIQREKERLALSADIASHRRTRSSKTVSS